QIVERFSGNIEVQIELLFDQKAYGPPILRQLGRRFIGTLIDGGTSDPVPPPPDTPQADYLLRLVLQPAEDSPDPGDASLYSQEAITQRPASQPTVAGLDFPESMALVLVWDGVAGAAETAALLALPGDEPFKRAVTDLTTRAAAPSEQFTRAELPAGPDQ